MAAGANVFRKKAIDLLLIQLSAIEITIGVVLKSYRDYESPKKPSMNQSELAKKTGTHQPVISGLEGGTSIPKEDMLKKIMKEIGLDPTKDAPKALFELLRYIQKHKDNLKALKKHVP